MRVIELDIINYQKNDVKLDISIQLGGSNRPTTKTPIQTENTQQSTIKYSSDSHRLRVGLYYFGGSNHALLVPILGDENPTHWGTEIIIGGGTLLN